MKEELTTGEAADFRTYRILTLSICSRAEFFPTASMAPSDASAWRTLLDTKSRSMRNAGRSSMN